VSFLAKGVITAPANPLSVGQEIRIGEGPFEGLAASIITMDEKDR